jgi:hypothetical protein
MLAQCMPPALMDSEGQDSSSVNWLVGATERAEQGGMAVGSE